MGGGYGIEVPCKYTFRGIPELVAWIAKCVIKENTKLKLPLIKIKTMEKRKERVHVTLLFVVKDCTNKFSLFVQSFVQSQSFDCEINIFLLSKQESQNVSIMS